MANFRSHDDNGLPGLTVASMRSPSAPVQASDVVGEHLEGVPRKVKAKRLNPRRRKAAKREIGRVEVVSIPELAGASSGLTSSKLAARGSGSQVNSRLGRKQPADKDLQNISRNGARKMLAMLKPAPDLRRASKLHLQEVRNLHSQTKDLRRKTAACEDLAARQEIQIGIHHTIVTRLKNIITCPLCLDVMNDPHVLAPCGHSACLNCLYEYFRRSSCLLSIQGRPATEVFTGPDEEFDTNLIHRTKVCFMCRTAVLLRPVAFYLGREIVENLRAAQPPGTKRVQKTTKQARLLSRPNGDIWKWTFQLDTLPRKWWDVEEEVWRCGCGHEIDGDRCSAGCAGEFDPPELSRRERRETALPNGVQEPDQSFNDSDSEALSTGPGHLEGVSFTSDIESHVEDEEEERMSFIEYSDDDEGSGGSGASEDEEYKDEEEDEEEEEDGLDVHANATPSVGAGVKRRRVVLDSESENSDTSPAKRIQVASGSDNDDDDDDDDEESEAVSDDFVQRSPPRSQRSGTASAFPHVISDSNDE